MCEILLENKGLGVAKLAILDKKKLHKKAQLFVSFQFISATSQQQASIQDCYG